MNCFQPCARSSLHLHRPPAAIAPRTCCNKRAAPAVSDGGQHPVKVQPPRCGTPAWEEKGAWFDGGGSQLRVDQGLTVHGIHTRCSHACLYNTPHRVCCRLCQQGAYPRRGVVVGERFQPPTRKATDKTPNGRTIHLRKTPGVNLVPMMRWHVLLVAAATLLIGSACAAEPRLGPGTQPHGSALAGEDSTLLLTMPPRPPFCRRPRRTA
jgi:hypothetical protein